MQESFNDKLYANNYDYLNNLKNEYKNAINSNIEDKVSSLEVDLYEYINKNFESYYSNKIKQAIQIKKNYANLWEIAFIHKKLHPKQVATYKSNEQKILDTIFSEKLCAYYSLHIFHKCYFSKEKILELNEPDKFAFTQFRFKAKKRYFDVIVDDLIFHLSALSKQNHPNFQETINYDLLKSLLTEAEVILVCELYKRKPLKIIAKELNKSENTLKTQRNAIYDKLQVKNQEELIEKITLKG